MLEEHKKQLILKNMNIHNKHLSSYATRDNKAIRFEKENKDIRSPFFRDIDRVIHSMSYTRYMDKTQVFSYQNNDHITKRMVHVQLVSKIARTIGRALGLNEDLIEAASLAHDLGHVPFGHVGESILNKISLENGEGYFNHNVQSVRLLMNVENGGKGRNITLQVLDAIMCHNGKFICKEYKPKYKTKEDFLNEYTQAYKDQSIIKNLVPMTLEGCVVRISDMIAYLGRDINDACALKVFEKKDLPKEIVDVLGSHNGDIINTIIMDVVYHSIGKNEISMSEEVYQAMKKLKDFNMENIYVKANSLENLKFYEEMFRCVFKHCLDDIKNKNENGYIYQEFLLYKNEEYLKCSDVRKVIDYLAGMTDDYLLNLYSNYNS